MRSLPPFLRLFITGWLCTGWLGLAATAQVSEPAKAPGTRATVSGYLRDAATGEALIGATVLIKSLSAGATANEYGFYSLTVPRGSYAVTYTYVGYAPFEETLDLVANLTHSVKLKAEGITTDEVVVSGKVPDQNVKSVETGVNRLDARAIKLVPALLGEADVVRAIQLLPGVSTVGEGATGFNVRGGGIDQNLILLDEAPVYNSSHLFGLFSVFNPDAVKDIKLVKGGIPAAYGGRLSSLLDIRMKDGNSQRLTATGGLGTVSSRLTIEAPIVKDKGSFILAARRSYADLFLKLVPEQKDNQAYFYDFSAKANYTLGERDRVYLSGYFGRDVFKLGNAFQNNWGNQTGTLRWNHVFNPRLFVNVTALASRYDYGLGVPSGTQGFDWKSDITNYSAKADFDFFRTSESTLRFGVSNILYTFEPGRVKPTQATSIFRELRLQRQQAAEYAAYLDEERSFGPAFSVQYGLRATLFQNTSSGTFFDYTGERGRQLTPINPKTYTAGSAPVASYFNLEPRFSARYALSELGSLKASYQRMVQYVHLISNTTAATPLDVWLPSTRNVKPERADQVSLGYFRNFKNNAYEASFEVFGKQLDNQIDYIAGANTLLNQNLEAELLYGRGRAYGAELYVKKNEGLLTGWLSYTLSRSERQIDGINQDKWYANKYDKTHVLALVGVYAVSKRLTVSSTFNYSTGVASTAPDSRYVYQGVVVPNVAGDARNNFRVPAYHRLDLAATWQQKRNTARRWQGEWVFSLYNVYARRNAFGIFFRQNADNAGQTEAVRLAVLGSILPSVTYNFTF